MGKVSIHSGGSVHACNKMTSQWSTPAGMPQLHLVYVAGKSHPPTPFSPCPPHQLLLVVLNLDVRSALGFCPHLDRYILVVAHTEQLPCTSVINLVYSAHEVQFYHTYFY